jgi:hypothetical protein
VSSATLIPPRERVEHDRPLPGPLHRRGGATGAAGSRATAPTASRAATAAAQRAAPRTDIEVDHDTDHPRRPGADTGGTSHSDPAHRSGRRKRSSCGGGSAPQPSALQGIGGDVARPHHGGAAHRGSATRRVKF